MNAFHSRIRHAALSGATALMILTSAPPVVADPYEDAVGGEHAATVADQIAGLESMCSQASEAIEGRQVEESLYDRLGGEERIGGIVAEIVRLHFINAELEAVMEGIDGAHLIERVSQFIVAGTGGPPVYGGRDMASAHSHLELTNAHFLSAGNDVMQAMKNKGCAEEEIQEIVCILVALRTQVVVESEKLLQ